MKKKKTKRIPKFKNEDEEREFWSTHDSTDYINWTQEKKSTFAKLKPSVKTISPPSNMEDTVW